MALDILQWGFFKKFIYVYMQVKVQKIMSYFLIWLKDPVLFLSLQQKLSLKEKLYHLTFSIFSL